MKTAFKIIIILLGLIIIFELGLYYYLSNQENTPDDIDRINTSEPVTIQNNYTHSNQAIDQNTLSRWYTLLRWFKKDVLVSSRMINSYEGEIVKINKEGGVFAGDNSEFDNTEYAKSLTIRGYEGGENWFFFRDSGKNIDGTYKQVTITDQTENEEREVDFDDLSIGDYLEIEQELILTNPFETSSLGYEIVRVDKP